MAPNDKRETAKGAAAPRKAEDASHEDAETVETRFIDEAGDEWVLDEEQIPEFLLERMKRNAAKPDVALQKAERIARKNAEFGLIYRRLRDGYRSRMKRGESAAA
jgi:hypothetical protein